jgi:2-methylcitrate dehydratase PrpD
MHYDSPLNQPFEFKEFPQGHASFSLRYNVANVLVRKCNKLEHLTESAISNPEVGNLARKVTVTDKMPPDKIESSRVTVNMKDGQVFSACVDCAKGNPLLKPLSKKEIEGKFRDNTAFSKTISRDNAEKVLEMLNNIEKIDNVNKLVKLLVV